MKALAARLARLEAKSGLNATPAGIVIRMTVTRDATGALHETPATAHVPTPGGWVTLYRDAGETADEFSARCDATAAP